MKCLGQPPGTITRAELREELQRFCQTAFKQQLEEFKATLVKEIVIERSQSQLTRPGLLQSVPIGEMQRSSSTKSALRMTKRFTGAFSEDGSYGSPEELERAPRSFSGGSGASEARISLHTETDEPPNSARSFFMETEEEKSTLLGNAGPGKPNCVCSAFNHLCETMTHVVQSEGFTFFSAFLVGLNAIEIGVATDYMARNVGQTPPPLLEGLELFFCTAFFLELVLRLAVFRCSFFTGADQGWNLFDFFIVSLQVLETVINAVVRGANVHIPFLQLIRLLRIARIMRLGRVLHTVIEFRSMVSSILSSLKPLFWAMVLFSILLYSFAVGFTHIVTQWRKNVAEGIITPRSAEDKALLDLNFGSLSFAFLKLWECITDGVEWKDVAEPMVREISPITGFVFSAYIAFSTMAMMSVVTAIFVHNAKYSTKADQDTFLSRHVSTIFPPESGEITWEDFQKKIETDEMKALFQSVDVDLSKPSQARGLFKLLDSEGTGKISPLKLQDGWKSIRGPAKALNLSLIARDMNRFAVDVTWNQAMTLVFLDWLHEAVVSIRSQTDLPPMPEAITKWREESPDGPPTGSPPGKRLSFRRLGTEGARGEQSEHFVFDIS